MLSPISRYAAVLAGDHKHVATRSTREVVRDLGVGNRITGPGSEVTVAAPVGVREAAGGRAEGGAAALRWETGAGAAAVFRPALGSPVHRLHL